MLTKKSHLGFSVIELLIGLVIGLIVSTSLIVFISSALKANNDTVKSMKLNQELRSLSEIIVRDLRRARGMRDPLVNVGSVCDSIAATSTTADDCVGLAFRNVNLSTAGCAVYGYDSLDNNNFRSTRLVTTSNVGSVWFNRGTTAQTCNSGGVQISSSAIDIESLTFDNCTYIDAGGVTRTLGDCINVTVSGKLTNDPNNIINTYTTSVGVRSGAM